MGDFEAFEKNITSTLDKIEKELESLHKKDHSAKQSSLKRIEMWFQQTKTLSESYEIEMMELEKEEQTQYQDWLKSSNQRSQKLKQEFQQKKKESTVNNLFDDRAPELNTNNMTATEMIELGDRVQQQGTDALHNIITIVDDGIDLANNINMELDKQIEQLDRLKDTVKDTQTELKRTQKYLKYFARNLYTDKLIMCLIFLVFAGIVTLIVLSAMGYNDTKTSASDQVQTTDSGTVSEVTNRILIQGQQKLMGVINII